MGSRSRDRGGGECWGPGGRTFVTPLRYTNCSSTYLGIGRPGGRGGLPRHWYTTCLCSFSPWAAQKSKFPKLIFSIL